MSKQGFKYQAERPDAETYVVRGAARGAARAPSLCTGTACVHTRTLRYPLVQRRGSGAGNPKLMSIWPRLPAGAKVGLVWDAAG